MQAISRSVRSASPHDAAACVAIYRPYVENTAISWEIEAPSVDEMASRIASAQKAHERVVLEHDGQVIGFAYGHALHRVPSFQWSVETRRRRPSPRRRRPHTLRRSAAPPHRSRLPESVRRHHPAQQGQQRFLSILRVSGCRPLPARRMETRQLARRRMHATRSARPRRPGWTAWPNHLIATLIGAHAKRGSTGAVGRGRRYSRSPW